MANIAMSTILIKHLALDIPPNFQGFGVRFKKVFLAFKTQRFFFFLLFMFDNQIRANITVSYFIREGWMVNIAPIRNVSNTKIY